MLPTEWTEQRPPSAGQAETRGHFIAQLPTRSAGTQADGILACFLATSRRYLLTELVRALP